MILLALLLVRWHCLCCFVGCPMKAEEGGESYLGLRSASRGMALVLAEDQEEGQIREMGEDQLEEHTRCVLEEDQAVLRMLSGMEEALKEEHSSCSASCLSWVDVLLRLWALSWVRCSRCSSGRTDPRL